MKRFGWLFITLVALGLLAGCGATPNSDVEMGQAAGQDGGGMGGPGQNGNGRGAGGYADGQGIDRIGGSSSNLSDPNRNDPNWRGAGGAGGYPGGAGAYPGGELSVEPEHRILFDFNSAQISAEAARILAHNAGWIRSRVPSGTITIEGHCDERGTREYNLALGQQRADAIRQFLISQGVEAQRMESVSYGKERPLVWGHDESAWRTNRRGEIVLP